MKIPASHLVLPLVLSAAAGCAPALEPIRVRAADVAAMPESGVAGRPLIVEFNEGDLIPIDLSFQSDQLELTPAAPGLAFRARRRFFVRVAADGLAVSDDGVHFGARPIEPGRFRLGLSVRRRQGARVEVEVKTPVRAPSGG